VTVSYYKWVQNKRMEAWTEREVDARLDTLAALSLLFSALRPAVFLIKSRYSF
jgi:hypothetical protein